MICLPRLHPGRVPFYELGVEALGDAACRAARPADENAVSLAKAVGAYARVQAIFDILTRADDSARLRAPRSFCLWRHAEDEQGASE
jgi:hypothetical protein